MHIVAVIWSAGYIVTGGVVGSFKERINNDELVTRCFDFEGVWSMIHMSASHLGNIPLHRKELSLTGV